LTVGVVVALVTLLNRLYGPITALSNVQVDVMTTLVSFDRVLEVLALEPLVKDAPDAVDLDWEADGGGSGAARAAGPGAAVGAAVGAAEGVSGGASGVERPAPPPAPAIRFREVWFRYPTADEVSLASLEAPNSAGPGREAGAGRGRFGARAGTSQAGGRGSGPGVEREAEDRATAGRGDEGSEDPEWRLEDVSFEVPRGSMVALVGPSGAGKTTASLLVSRLYDTTRGTVELCGQDVRGLTASSIRRNVGTVTQDAHLFHATMRQNLLFAKPGATDAELWEALGRAQAGFAADLPEGLDTVVGELGYRLSGGERQRVAIARLLLKAPHIVVLDEATAHLDAESEAAVQRALAEALRGRTSLVIAHRLSTIRAADQIVVLDQGRVVERGTHQELLAAGGLYAALYRVQFADAHS
jgi:ATP-binding cassette subfamily B protein